PSTGAGDASAHRARAKMRASPGGSVATAMDHAVAPQHSFVVPAYGVSPHLRDCLASLRAQTVQSPVVIATSTPSPALEKIAAEFGADLAVHGPNAGIGRDWNFALSQAT